MAHWMPFITYSLLIVMTFLAFRKQLYVLWRRTSSRLILALSALLLVTVTVEAALARPIIVGTILLTLIAVSLIIITAVAVSLYTRLSGVPLHYVDSLLQNKRRDSTPKWRAPDGME